MRSVQGIVALLVLLAATRATAFVTLQDGFGNDIYWNKSTIKWYLHPNGSADVPFADAQSALTAAFQAWKGTGCIAKTLS